MTSQQVCNFFKITPEQLKKQYEANAEGLAQMLAKARRTGKKVNGYTAIQLENMTAKYYMLAQNVK